MPAENLIALPNEPASAPCKKAFWILTAAHRTVSELLSLFDNPGGSPRPQGNPSHADQDILRSMIVFAGAGLDSSVKQLVKDAYAKLIERDTEVQKKGLNIYQNRLDGVNPHSQRIWSDGCFMQIQDQQ